VLGCGKDVYHLFLKFILLSKIEEVDVSHWTLTSKILNRGRHDPEKRGLIADQRATINQATLQANKSRESCQKTKQKRMGTVRVVHTSSSEVKFND